MFRYRPHRGSLEDSMREAKEFITMDQMAVSIHIIRFIKCAYLVKYMGMLRIIRFLLFIENTRYHMIIIRQRSEKHDRRESYYRRKLTWYVIDHFRSTKSHDKRTFIQGEWRGPIKHDLIKIMGDVNNAKRNERKG